jgi:hypothetical protein
MKRSIAAAALAAVTLASPALADWGQSAVSLGFSAPGQTGSVACPAGGTPGAIWGVGSYTSDSSICTAAMHMGLITPAAGGTVTFQTVPGQPSYPGSMQNGVSSMTYGSWSLSFVVTGATAGGAPVPAGPMQIGWDTSLDATGQGGSVGATLQFVCPPGQPGMGAVWGTDLYTSDSAICMAAQHRGVIAPGAGGLVQVLVLGRQQAFVGSARGGITSSDYGPWDRSYLFR